MTNRATGSVVPKILVLKKEKIAKEVYDLESFVKPTTYTETLLGTVEVTSSTGNLTIGCSQNEIIKLVIDSNCKRVDVGSVNYGNNIAKALAAGTYYIQLRSSVNKIYFYLGRIDTSTSGTIQVYKCSNRELFNYNPLVQSFYKYKDAGTFDTSKMTLGYQWNVNYNDKYGTASDATTGLIPAYNPRLRITLSDTTNYKFTIASYSTIQPKSPAGYDGNDSGWKTSFDGTLICNSFAITLRKNNGAITQEDLSVLSIEFVTPYVEYYVTQKEVEDYVAEREASILNTVNKINQIGSVNNGLNVLKPYYYHFSPDAFIKDGNDHNAIPSQTSFDIEIAARLGYTFIEANVQITSDGNFICMHGSAGKFGNTVYSLDNTNISNVAINTKTLSWIKENVRFNSYYDKYKVAPLSLEEFCKCCKVNGIGIFAGTDNLNAINLCLRILGTDNVMLYGAQSSKRSYFKGMMFVWNNNASTSVSSIISTARGYRIPFMYGIGPDLLDALVTNSNLESLCTQMHQEGFTVASTAVYDTEENTQNAFEAGVDFSASGHQVNPFDSADVVYDLNDSSAFSGTGTIGSGIASLANGETIICGDDNSIPLGKGMLTMKFNGSLTVNFGSVGSRTLSSDGIKDVVISDYFFMRKAKMVITANSSTTITNLVYKTKKC